MVKRIEGKNLVYIGAVACGLEGIGLKAGVIMRKVKRKCIERKTF